MWEPIVVIVGENLLLIAVVGLHAPDLHVPGALGIEINVFAIGGVLRAIVEAFGSGQPSFFPARHRNCIDVKIAVALADEGQCLSVRRPAMPVGGSIFGEAARGSASD